MRILLTAFDPFGTDTINPALEVLKALRGEDVKGADLVKLEIPTVFNSSAQVLEEFLDKEKVDALVHLGQAGGREAISIERVAINLDDARIKDNAGQQPIDQVIQEDGPAAYFSTLPIKAMAQAIRDQGLPAQVSNSAGTFVCNHLMYQSLYLLDKKGWPIPSGFIHVPYMEGQGQEGDFTMSLKDMTLGIGAALQTLVDFRGSEDLKTVEGSLH